MISRDSAECKSPKPRAEPEVCRHRNTKKSGYNHISSSTSDVVIASLHSEKTCLKKLMKNIIIIIINKSQEEQFLAGARN